MLRTADLLEEIYREGELSIAHLARYFATSRDQIQQAVVSLKQRGYLAEVEATKGKNLNPSWFCRFCPMRGHCGTESSLYGLRIYQLTEKGKQLIKTEKKEGNQWQ